MTKILYICDPCAEAAPEMCGHSDLSELRVLPDGATICQYCYDEIAPGKHDVKNKAEG